MMKLMLAVLLLATLSRAHPRFFAIPLDDVAMVEVAEAAGSAPGWQVIELVPEAARVARDTAAAEEDGGRVQRGAHHDDDHHGHGHDYVDYGAHTGHHGAYGWYADFPVKH